MSALLLVLVLLPLAGAVAVGLLARTNDRVAKLVGLAVSVLELVGVAVLWAAYVATPAAPGERFRCAFSVEWIPAFGTHIALGVDGIALTMIALLAVLTPLVLGF